MYLERWWWSCIISQSCSLDFAASLDDLSFWASLSWISKSVRVGLIFSNPSGAGLDLLVFMRGMSFCEVSFASLDGCRGVYIDDESLRKFFFFFEYFTFRCERQMYYAFKSQRSIIVKVPTTTRVINLVLVVNVLSL